MTKREQRLAEIRARLAASFPDMHWGGERLLGSYIVAQCGPWAGRSAVMGTSVRACVCGGKPSHNGPYPHADNEQAVTDAQFLGHAQDDIAWLLAEIEQLEKDVEA
mgnify:CR=1 FL=1